MMAVPVASSTTLRYSRAVIAALPAAARSWWVATIIGSTAMA